MKKKVQNTISFLVILVLFITNSYGQERKLLAKKSNWFFEISDTNNIFVDTLIIYKRITYRRKINKEILSSDWLYDDESEFDLFSHSSYGNLSFYGKDDLLFSAIINGRLKYIATDWKWTFRKNNTLEIICNKNKSYTYFIKNKTSKRIPMESDTGMKWTETTMLTLIKKTSNNI